MPNPGEGVNPLRPYYIPPSIGEPSTAIRTPPPVTLAHPNATAKYASKARDIFPDLDYKDYISEPSPSLVKSIKGLVDELLWKYTSVLMAQPFEVAKTILQVRSQVDLGPTVEKPEARPTLPAPRGSAYDQVRACLLRDGRGRALTGDKYDDYDSDPDEPSYFTSNMPSTPTPSHPRSQRPPTTPSPGKLPRHAKPLLAPYQLDIRHADSILEVVSQLWQKERAWGVWKGSNASFLYTVLQSLLENWSRSLLSALFNVPDLGLKNDIERLVDIASPYPWASLGVAAAAAVATGLILSPLDVVRTRCVCVLGPSRSTTDQVGYS